MACVPDDAIDRFTELTTGEERLYTRLCRYVCRDETSKDYGLAWPSRSTLAALMNCTETHISDLITELSRRGWVAKIGWKYRLLVGDFLLNSQVIPTIQPRKSRKKSTKSESNSRNIPTLSDNETVQKSESDLPIVGNGVANCRNLGVQLSEFEPTVRKNQNEPVIEPEEPVVGKPATKRASPKKPVLTDDLFLEELQNSGAYPGVNVHQEFMKASNWCIANDRQNTRKFFVNWLGRSRPMVVATNGNGVKSNGSGYKSQSERQDEALEAIAQSWAARADRGDNH